LFFPWLRLQALQHVLPARLKEKHPNLPSNKDQHAQSSCKPFVDNVAVPPTSKLLDSTPSCSSYQLNTLALAAFVRHVSTNTPPPRPLQHALELTPPGGSPHINITAKV
jgi:hypothetical protein